MHEIEKLRLTLCSTLSAPILRKHEERISKIFHLIIYDEERYQTRVKKFAIENKRNANRVIEEVIFNEYGFTFDQLRVKHRIAEMVEPRQMAMIFVNEFGTSLIKTGKIFDRHHATVMHAKKRVYGLADVDKNVRNLFDKLRNSINEKLTRNTTEQTKMESPRGAEPDSNFQNQVEVTTKKEHWNTIPKHDYSSAS